MGTHLSTSLDPCREPLESVKSNTVNSVKLTAFQKMWNEVFDNMLTNVHKKDVMVHGKQQLTAAIITAVSNMLFIFYLDLAPMTIIPSEGFFLAHVVTFSLTDKHLHWLKI